MNVDTESSAVHSVVPSDKQVAYLRNEGFEVQVFQKGPRRIVAIKFPCVIDGKTVYDTYDSELEAQGMFTPRTLTQRDVETLQGDPTWQNDRTRIISTKARITFVPDDDRVIKLRNAGIEVHVFQKGPRRMVTVRYPSVVAKGETEYEAYDSELEHQEGRAFDIKKLTPEDVEAMQNDPTWIES
ncbi:MAG: hypothetical protein LBC11_01535 [Puniceicoccales bacterium]|jgi:hypothetical protein|nr:hypothetical protein [Puniceicoccales bacterium]